MQDGNFKTHTCAVHEILTIQLGPQIISAEKLEYLDGLKIIYMFLGHLRYPKQPQLILIVDQSTALSNMKHLQLQYHTELLKTSPITLLSWATQNITNVLIQHNSTLSLCLYFVTFPTRWQLSDNAWLSYLDSHQLPNLLPHDDHVTIVIPSFITFCDVLHKLMNEKQMARVLYLLMCLILTVKLYLP